MKLFSTSSLEIPIKLNNITSNVDPKIIVVLFFVKEPNVEVIKLFSVSFILISLSDENKLSREGNRHHFQFR